MAKTEEQTKIRFEYHFAPDFREYYATGARGGMVNGYHMHLDFYNEKRRLSTVDHVTFDSEGKGTKVQSEDSTEAIVDRTYVMGLSLSFNAARELADWLNKGLKDIEKVERLRGKATKKGAAKNGGNS